MSEHLFEKTLSTCMVDIEFDLRSIALIEWSDFLLNPRRLRGSDFLMRWSQGVWSEQRLVDAVKATERLYAIPYGPSGTAPTDSVRDVELYFERLEAAGLGDLKRPDLLLFDARHKAEVNSIVSRFGGEEELPFTSEADLTRLLDLALLAVECENSLWVASKMPDYNATLKPMRRLGGRLGLKKAAVLPTIIVKEQDRGPLVQWQKRNSVPIHIWHVFFDRAYGIPLSEAERLFESGIVEPTAQTFQAPGGATTKKVIYKIYHHYAYDLAVANESPELVADYVEDKNGHILPYVRFEGGSLSLTDEALQAINRERK